MIDKNKISFRLLNENDFSVVETWLHKDYIKKWLGLPDEWMPEIRNDNNDFDYITHFMVVYEDIRIGYCHYYDISKVPKGYAWDNEPIGTYGIGYFIGEEEYLKRGIGNIIVKEICKLVIDNKNPFQLFADPYSDNLVSIHLLENNGFVFDESTGLYKYILTDAIDKKKLLL